MNKLNLDLKDVFFVKIVLLDVNSYLQLFTNY